jgi:hypothetical protein
MNYEFGGNSLTAFCANIILGVSNKNYIKHTKYKARG